MALYQSKKTIGIIKRKKCLCCLYSLRIKNKLESHKKVCENKDFADVVMPSEDTKILQFNQYLVSDKMPYIIYAEYFFESMIKGIDRCKNSSKNHLQQR